MNSLYIECKMGAAGDMLMASLLELLPDKNVFIEKMNNLGIPGVTVEATDSVKCGIRGTHMVIKVNGMEEHEYFHALKHAHGITHEHSHTHDSPDTDHHHEHSHTHTGMHEIRHIIADLNVSEKVRSDIEAVYKLVAEAESHAHGISVDEVHFHEVGAMDAVADITGVCLLMEMLAPKRVLVSPVHVGSGYVRCTHGTLPVPAPATAYILKGVPVYSGNVKGELCTPTGAALLKHFADEFCEMPVMTISALGYGMGMKEFEQANCVRSMLFESQDESSISDAIELACNLDDMTPEAIAFACELLLKSGAMDVWTESIGMKKGRPGIKLCCLCGNNKKDEIIRKIFRHTSTIGIREYPCERHILDRRTESRETPFGTVRVKVSSGYDVIKEKAEYDDLAAIAIENDISIGEILK